MYVTFAGSPDRVEAQLVPDAGYELDTFRISGFPRQPSPRSSRALCPGGRRAARVPRDPARAPAATSSSAAAATSPGRWCFAAATLRHPGGARPRPTRTSGSRTGSPRRSRSASSSPIRSRRADERSTASSAGRSRRARARSRRTRRARSSSCRTTGRVLVVFGALAGRPLAQRVRRRGVRRGRARRSCTSPGERDYASLKRRVPPRRLPADRRDRPDRRGASRPPTSCSRASG